MSKFKMFDLSKLVKSTEYKELIKTLRLRKSKEVSNINKQQGTIRGLL